MEHGWYSTDFGDVLCSDCEDNDIYNRRNQNELTTLQRRADEQKAKYLVAVQGITRFLNNELRDTECCVCLHDITVFTPPRDVEDRVVMCFSCSNLYHAKCVPFTYNAAKTQQTTTRFCPLCNSHNISISH